MRTVARHFRAPEQEAARGTSYPYLTAFFLIIVDSEDGKGCQSLVSVNFFQHVNPKIRAKRKFIINKLS